MIDYDAEIQEMVAIKNLMNSYKLYFLKAIIVNASIDKRVFSFYEMACWMCAYSFSDVCALGRRIRPLDKLYDAAVLTIEKEDLMESSKIIEVYDAVSNTDSKELLKLIMALCDYVPYRLLAYMWPQELKGMTDRQKNRIIEELSCDENRCMYSILSISQNKKNIEIHSEWIVFIMLNRMRLTKWIDQRIVDFIRKG